MEGVQDSDMVSQVWWQLKINSIREILFLEIQHHLEYKLLLRAPSQEHLQQEQMNKVNCQLRSQISITANINSISIRLLKKVPKLLTM
jgi:hypothetical protein